MNVVGKVGEYPVAIRYWECSSPVTSALEPEVEINLLPQDMGPLSHPSFHSLPILGFPRYPFIEEDEQLGEWCADCPSPGSNSGLWIWSQTCSALHL